MLANPWIAALAALFLWWFSTGAILWLVKHADKKGGAAQKGAAVVAIPVLAAGGVGYLATLNTLTTGGVLGAFVSALAIWGAIEIAFLTGVVTGPNRTVCPRPISEWERFFRAIGTIAYHELALIAALLLMASQVGTASNGFGFWTFAILFFARISAKLNLFLGVPKINTEFLPKPLAHLPSHFHHDQMNWLFPYSVTILTFSVTCWLERIYAAETQAQVTGFALLAALSALALLEHWFMVVKLPDEKLWRWLLPAQDDTPKKTTLSEDAHGL